MCAITNWPAPTNRQELQSFLGFCNFYRRFIHNFANTAQPLQDLLKNETPYVWSAAAQNSFASLKLAFTTAPVLRLPDFTKDFLLTTDASDYAIGAVLQQEFDNGPQPICYLSRTLTPAERNYATHEKEMLAIVHAISTWRHYLLGNTTTVNSDHRSLTYLQTQPKLNQRQARWMELLQEYDLSINYIKGTDNAAADALSRLNPPPETRPATLLNAVRILDLPLPEDIPAFNKADHADPFSLILHHLHLNGITTRSAGKLRISPPQPATPALVPPPTPAAPTSSSVTPDPGFSAQLKTAYATDQLAQDIFSAAPRLHNCRLRATDFTVSNGLIYVTNTGALYIPMTRPSAQLCCMNTTTPLTLATSAATRPTKPSTAPTSGPK